MRTFKDFDLAASELKSCCAQKASQHSSSKEGQDQNSDEIKAKPQLLEKIKEELDNEVYKMTMFLCYRSMLENHRELFKLQLEDMEREREDNKEKIQSVEKLITESEREKATETTEELLREKQKLLSAQWTLERRKEELKKVQLNTEKVLQSEEADGLLTRMTERKQNLEKGAYSLGNLIITSAMWVFFWICHSVPGSSSMILFQEDHKHGMSDRTDVRTCIEPTLQPAQIRY
ncbi:uncharacterized protein LOC115590456 [Sparus aurata]|uniref:uncharacterized protein LOC115590456 n=1 Tax=Sparus aurata TaxID=8175 RepID=UPI0011C0E43B|nr:uncharacterized protein LOC115590456 [Sparus aurata]